MYSCRAFVQLYNCTAAEHCSQQKRSISQQNAVTDSRNPVTVSQNTVAVSKTQSQSAKTQSQSAKTQSQSGTTRSFSNNAIMEELEEQQFQFEEEEEAVESPARKKRKATGAVVYQTKFKDEWKKEFPWISAVFGDPHRFRCNVCCVNILCNHQGKGNVKAHCRTTGHQQKAMALEKQPRLSDFLTDPTKPSWTRKLSSQR